jgi:spore coat polysaccharide biosynthesis predicted glycosyltransferase SpsG
MATPINLITSVNVVGQVCAAYSESGVGHVQRLENVLLDVRFKAFANKLLKETAKQGEPKIAVRWSGVFGMK